jgi:hypothetical protein
VGDAIHEGYSDYLAASYVSEANNTDATLVGEYALRNCTPLQRELATLKVYDGADELSDPHVSGLVWASALWRLRDEFGVSVADHIAVKSLFYQSTTPGFFDAIEALVKADADLYAGAHETRIRQIFYNEAKFLGSLTDVFQDADNKIVKVGLRGCSAVHTQGGRPAWTATLILGLLWLGATLVVGRRWRA